MSVQIIGYPLRKRAELPCRILIEIDRDSLLSNLNVQKQGVECQQAQATRYEENSSPRSDGNLHQRLSTQSIVNLKSLSTGRYSVWISFFAMRYALCALRYFVMADFFMDDPLPCYFKTLSNVPRPSTLLAAESLWYESGGE
jgi:hypothetical protein